MSFYLKFLACTTCFLITDLERQINMESNKLQGTEPSRTMDTVHTEIQEKQELVNGYGKKIEQKRQKLINFQHQLTQHERYMNDLRSRKVCRSL